MMLLQWPLLATRVIPDDNSPTSRLSSCLDLLPHLVNTHGHNVLGEPDPFLRSYWLRGGVGVVISITLGVPAEQRVLELHWELLQMKRFSKREALLDADRTVLALQAMYSYMCCVVKI